MAMQEDGVQGDLKVNVSDLASVAWTRHDEYRKARS